MIYTVKFQSVIPDGNGTRYIADYVCADSAQELFELLGVEGGDYIETSGYGVTKKTNKKYKDYCFQNQFGKFHLSGTGSCPTFPSSVMPDVNKERQTATLSNYED